MARPARGSEAALASAQVAFALLAHAGAKCLRHLSALRPPSLAGNSILPARTMLDK